MRALVWLVGLLALMGVNTLMFVWWERKFIARIHRRHGPLHHGWHGLLQLPADGLKMLTKESTRPLAADRMFFSLAPAMVVVPTYVAYVALPFGPGAALVDMRHGLFFVFAFQALLPVGFTVAGWASANKYSLLGALRSSAQQISYEVPMLLGALSVVVMAGSLRLTDIVSAQHAVWYVFKQPVGFVLTCVAMIAEMNRTPFDMPEAESELVAGYNVEYSGMRYGLFMMAEYSVMFVGTMLVSMLYLGGWNLPFLPASPLWLLLKVWLLVTALIWVRGTLPRVRVDILMETSWKVLIPIGFANLLLIGLLTTIWPRVF